MTLAEAVTQNNDLAVGALTLVPLVLITSALDANILPSTRASIQRRHEAGKHARAFQLAALTWGLGMSVAAMAAIGFALVDLVHHNNRFDGEIFWFSAAVTAGLGMSFVRRIYCELWRDVRIEPKPTTPGTKSPVGPADEADSSR